MLRYKESFIYIVFIIIIFVVALQRTYPKLTEIINVAKNINSTTLQVSDLERKLETLKKAEMDKLAETEQAEKQTKRIYKPEVSGLEAEAAFAVLFDDIIDMAKYNGLKIYAIESNYNPTDDQFVKGDPNKYNVCELSMDVISDYQDLESFIKELYKYPYLISIGKIDLMPYVKNKKILLTKLQLKLYADK